jgi:hypothetical protein
MYFKAKYICCYKSIATPVFIIILHTVADTCCLATDS